jgi:hypothetical protein
MSGLRANMGRIGVPVKSSVSVYANFDHVYGIPSSQGMSLLKARAMDVMIDRMVEPKDSLKTASTVSNMQLLPETKSSVQTSGSLAVSRYLSRPVSSGQFVNFTV